MSLYRVVGSAPFRMHERGSTFEAELDPHLEARAIRRGSIELVERSKPRLVPGSFRLPINKEEEFDA